MGEKKIHPFKEEKMVLFLVYTFINDTHSGIGNHIFANKNIRSLKDLREIDDLICQIHGNNKVVITDFKKLKNG